MMEQSTFTDTLRRALENDALIGIFSDPSDPAGFMAGWVEAVTDEHVLLRHLSRHGRYDGYRLLHLEEIFRVDTEGRYLERLLSLSQAREERFLRLFEEKVSSESDLIVETLRAAQRRELMVRVYILERDNESGRVKDLSHDTVTIERLDHYGAADCDAMIHLEAISNLSCDDEALQDLRILASHHDTEPPSWLN